ncbi:hypothetical protein Tco_1060583 [Tanacetum coccineum]
METIHVQFDELSEPMDLVQLNAGLAPTFLTPRQISSGLVPNPVLTAPYVPGNGYSRKGQKESEKQTKPSTGWKSMKRQSQIEAKLIKVKKSTAKTTPTKSKSTPRS